MEDPVSLSETGEVDKLDTSNNLPFHSSNKEVLVMTVEIGDGRQDIIKILENDDPEVLAGEFAAKHDLDESLRQNLAMLIKQNQAVVEMRAVSTSPDAYKWTDPIGNSSRQTDLILPDKDLASSKPLPQVPRQSSESVFDRLYKQGKKKSTLPNPPKQVAKTKSVANINYGEWLYIKGMKMKESQKLKAEERKRTKEREELALDYSFKPQINEYSNLLAPRYFERTEDLLLRKAMDYTERKEQLRRKASENELKECSFTPKIITATKPDSAYEGTTKHELLYLEAENRRKKHQMNVNNSNSCFRRPGKATKQSQDEFSRRHVENKQKFDLKMKTARESAIREELSPGRNSLFRPGRDPKIERNTSEGIHEYLYSKRQEKTEKLNRHNQAAQEKTEESARSTKAGPNSNRLFDQLRGKLYAKLFTNMDSDDDGLLSSDAIHLDGVDNRTLEILTPLLKQLDEGIELGLNDFVNVMEDIWKKLNVEQRGFLMKKEQKAQTAEEVRVWVNPKSVKLTEQRKDYFTESVYERQTKARRLTEMKNLKVRELSEEAKLTGCTFRPAVNRRKLSSNRFK